MYTGAWHIVYVELGKNYIMGNGIFSWKLFLQFKLKFVKRSS